MMYLHKPLHNPPRSNNQQIRLFHYTIVWQAGTRTRAACKSYLLGRSPKPLKAKCQALKSEASRFANLVRIFRFLLKTFKILLKF